MSLPASRRYRPVSLAVVSVPRPRSNARHYRAAALPPDRPPPRVVLAPMEGVIDAAMRARLTSLGGYARCVTEFVRVCDLLLPERVFLRLCPELERGGRTPSGTPVYVQLLGSDPAALARNARRAVTLGAPGIDLNFGCPAKTVNRSEGGSVLLREPARVARIVAAVRDAVPREVPLTVKIRLGYEHGDALAEIVAGIRAAGADELAIHARTKRDGYRPPARWASVAAVRAADGGPTLINGEIWSVADSVAARRESGCGDVMLGRGALAAPDLARRILRAAARGGAGRRESGVTPTGRTDAAGELADDDEPLLWAEVVDIVQAQFHTSDAGSPRHVGNRTKQWLAYLRRTYPGADALFARLRTLHERTAIDAAFDAHRARDLAASPASAVATVA